VRMMENEVKVVIKGFENYPLWRVFVGNLIMLLGLVVGTVAIWFINPIAAGVYLILAVLLVYVVMRKLVCTNCYYYNKWCSMGWGKLAALMFKQGKIEDFNKSIGITLAPLVYGLLTFIPIVIVILLLIFAFDYPKLSVLIILVFFAVYSGSVGRRSACSDCKMKESCKGSTIKQ